LLAGSVTLFGCLALAMVLTRQVDWYQLGDTLGARLGKDANKGAVTVEPVGG